MGQGMKERDGISVSGGRIGASPKASVIMRRNEIRHVTSRGWSTNAVFDLLYPILTRPVLNLNSSSDLLE